jgi:Baseplate J-like protein
LAFLTPLSLSQIQQTVVNFYNAAAATNGIPPVDTGQGSALGPVLNSAAFAIFQAQNEIIYVAAISRLSTIPANADGSPNPDVDTFVAPFGFTRVFGTASGGQLLFSTPSAVATQVVIPVGAIAQTPGGLQFQVIADTTNAAYSATLNGYPITIGNASVSASAQCLSTGVQGNVVPGSITQLFGGTTGAQIPAPVNGVTNPLAFTGGANLESDAALKTRFTAGISTGRNTGTAFCVISAAMGTNPNLILSYGDRLNADGTTHNAYFTLVAAISGSTSPTPASVLNAIGGPGLVPSALEGNPPMGIPQARPAGISYQVIGPTQFNSVTISGALTLSASAVSATVIASAQAAVAAYINSIGLLPYALPGASSTLLSYTKIAAILWSIPGIVNVDGILLNGGTSDITCPFAQMFTPGALTFTTSYV